MLGSSNNILFELDKNDYHRLLNTNMLYIKANITDCTISSNLLMEFLINDNFYQYLNECIKTKSNLQFVLKNNNEIISKVTFSIVTIIVGIGTLSDLVTLTHKEKIRLSYLKNKIDFNKYLSKNYYEEFEFLVDNKRVKLKCGDVLSIFIEPQKYLNFVNGSDKLFNLTKEQFVFCLKEFFIKEKIFDCYILNNSFIKCYQYLVLTYDTEAINKFLTTTPLNDDFNLNSELVDDVYRNIKTKNKLEQVIYIYYYLIQLLTYDEEFDEVDGIAKKHKDFSRIEFINSKNNRVVNYEFSAIFAKFLENLNINYEYNDSNISFRINKYLLRAKAISKPLSTASIESRLKGLTLLNHHRITKQEFEKIISSVYQNIYENKLNITILGMTFTESIDMYKRISSKNNINFKEKLELLISLISDSDNIGGINMGYIYQLKTILFSEDELNSNINFTVMSENTDKGSNPVVIITYNEININLYNSNHYIYYNPPLPLEEYDLQELRKAFFNGRFSYIKGTKENIIGLEKSSVC